MTTNSPIYYFGYGPSVNPLVRKRRQLQTSEEQPAVLHDYRLTFAYGGIANIVHQRGYEVHGILMKFNSLEDWERFQTLDAGYNESDLVPVVPYNRHKIGGTSSGATDDNPNDEDLDDEDLVKDVFAQPPEHSSNAIQAYAMTMKDYDESKLEAPIEQLPTETYLKLIANGMREYQVNEDYILDQIMGVPYLPSCKPEDYKTIPLAANHKSGRLPKITLSKYYKLCRKNTKYGGDIYFVMDRHVIKLGPHDPEHPAAMWFKERAHGQRDSTLIIHHTVIEPSLAHAERYEDLTPAHYACVENQVVEYLRKCNLKAEKVFELKLDNNDNNTNNNDGDDDNNSSSSNNNNSPRNVGERRRSWLPERLSFTRRARHSMGGNTSDDR